MMLLSRDPFQDILRDKIQRRRILESILMICAWIKFFMAGTK